MASDKFKVFISWSGTLSKQVASVWYDLVKEIFDVVEPFMSEENIGAGVRGLEKIAIELSGSSFGIIVVTQENQSSQWLNYEAGALSKDLGVESVRVAPSLVDFSRKNDVTGPLGQFQASLLDEGGVRSILIEIAKVVGADEASVTKRFIMPGAKNTRPDLPMRSLRTQVSLPMPTVRPMKCLTKSSQSCVISQERRTLELV